MKVDLLNGKLNKTYLTLLISAIGSTVITTIYSTVDMICVGHHSGPDGTAAIACMSPMWALIFGFGFLLGVGGSVMAANKRGARDEQSANEYYTVSVVISLAASLALFLVYTLLPRQLLTLFGAEGRVLDLAVEYTRAVCFSFPTFTMCACLSTFMRCDGEAIIPTVATIVGGVINILLDVLLVFGLDLGVRGAGLATGIGQSIAFVIILAYFFTRKCNFKFTKIKNFARIFLTILTVGFSAFIIEVATGVVSAVHNVLIMEHLSPSHLAVYGVVSSATIMFYCIFSAVGTALQPLVSTCFGAARTDRVRSTLRLSLLSVFVMGALFIVTCEAFPTVILRVYMDVNDEVLAIGPRIVRLYCCALPAMGLSLLCSSYFQSTLNRLYSALISTLRGLVFPLIAVVLLPLWLGYDYIWLGIPIAELLTAAIATVLLVRVTRKHFNNIRAD